MKTHLLASLMVFSLASLAFGADAPQLKDQKQKFSYSVGMNLANGWKRQSIEVDTESLFQGIKDAMGGKTLLTESESREIIMAFQREQRARQEEIRKQQGEKNKKEGETFLAENKKKDGVVTLPSGLQYKVLVEGKGESPKATDTVTVNYRGTLLDGTEFDSSYKRGQPATFNVTGVIRGWTEALQLMKPGAKWQLYIPAELAYGERGSGANIGPNAALQFEVELISFKGTQPATAEPVTSDIIRVPSADEMKAGAKIEVIKASEVEKFKAAEKEKTPDKEKAPEQPKAH
jgi:FKBP-type peptidyl-prolyl cis-trans isomerase FklB